MKKTITLLLCMAAPYIGHASVNGVVKDPSANPIGYANVTLWQDSLFIAGIISDDNGNFSFDDNIPSYNILKVYIMGYKEYVRNITPADSGIVVNLEPKTNLLNEVEILGNPPSHRLVRGGVLTKIRNTTSSLLGNAMDVISQQPGVRSFDGMIEVFGKGVPEIYVNGRKLNNYNELYTLPSKEIDTIEVLSNPGARYGTEIRSVILIKTVKKQGDGFSGTISTGARLARYAQQSDNTSINYRK